MRTVLFICTHNAVRSQMGEGLVNTLYTGRLKASSAGTSPGTVHPLAVRVMAEIGIDISGQRSKGLEEFEGREFDHVIMVCSDSAETCPFFPGGKEQVHRAFADPSVVNGDEEERLAAFRRTRDEIRAWLRDKFGEPVSS